MAAGERQVDNKWLSKETPRKVAAVLEKSEGYHPELRLFTRLLQHKTRAKMCKHRGLGSTWIAPRGEARLGAIWKGHFIKASLWRLVLALNERPLTVAGGTGSQDTGPFRPSTHVDKDWAGPPEQEPHRPPRGPPHLTVSELQILAFIVQVVGLQMQEKLIP